MSTKAQLTDGSTYWGVCWRLAGIPGWTFTLIAPDGSRVTDAVRGTSVTPTRVVNDPILTINDAAGSEIGRWERPR